MARVTQYSAVNLIPETGVDPGKWNTLPSADTVQRTVAAVESRGIRVILAENGAAALSLIRELIPPESEVMNGSSTTLIEIGYLDFVESGKSGWRDLHTIVTSENDEKKRAELRRKSVAAEYFVSGTNAIATTGKSSPATLPAAG